MTAALVANATDMACSIELWISSRRLRCGGNVRVEVRDLVGDLRGVVGGDKGLRTRDYLLDMDWCQ